MGQIANIYYALNYTFIVPISFSIPILSWQNANLILEVEFYETFAPCYTQVHVLFT